MEKQCEVCSSVKKKYKHGSAKDRECFVDRGCGKSVKLINKSHILVTCSNFSYVRSIRFF